MMKTCLDCGAPKSDYGLYCKKHGYEHRAIRPFGAKYVLKVVNPTSFKKGGCPWNKGLTGVQSGENNPFYGKHHDADAIQKMSKRRTDTSKMRIPKTGNHRQKMSEITKAAWKDKGFVKKQMMARGVVQNKQELKLEQILNDLYPGEWKFVGDGQIIIAGKCPDFINVNGQKKIIELYGDYWHQGQDPQDRIDVFTPFGFDTLVIWERELEDGESLMVKIRDFNHQTGYLA